MFYARLHLALQSLDDATHAEVEFVGRHLNDIEQHFSTHWDHLPGPPHEPAIRWVDGAFTSIPALYSIEGRLTQAGVIELRNIRLVIDPDAD